MNKEDVKKGYLAAMATMEVEPEYAEQYWESYESSQHWINNKSKLKKYTAYLFKISLYYGDPPEYVMSHAKNEEEARIKASLKLRYNCGDPVEPKSLELVTYF